MAVDHGGTNRVAMQDTPVEPVATGALVPLNVSERNPAAVLEAMRPDLHHT